MYVVETIVSTHLTIAHFVKLEIKFLKITTVDPSVLCRGLVMVGNGYRWLVSVVCRALFTWENMGM
jgi:hypothetical protein